MNRLSSSTYPGESATHERAIEALARESHVPIDQVAQLYEHELSMLKVGARITGFLTILTTRAIHVWGVGNQPCTPRVSSRPRHGKSKRRRDAG